MKEKIIKDATFKRVKIVKCARDMEWDSARLLWQKYFFTLEDPYIWTFNHPEHAHFILYQDADIVGYAHVQFWPDHRAALRIFVIDEPYRHRSLGSHCLHLCEVWLRKQGIHSLHEEARSDASRVLSQKWYTEMPFDDSTGELPSVNDLAMGKMP